MFKCVDCGMRESKELLTFYWEKILEQKMSKKINYLFHVFVAELWLAAAKVSTLHEDIAL